MFILCADKNRLTVRQREAVTSGSVNVSKVCFEFSPEWDSLTRTAVFKAGAVSRSVPLDGANTCAIPWETLEKPNILLTVGVYGTHDGDTVLPTVWASLGIVLEGATLGSGAQPPTPDLWEQGPAGGREEDGASDHRLLTNRDAERQHPIGAIEGLDEELKRIPEPAEALTNIELEALLK